MAETNLLRVWGEEEATRLLAVAKEDSKAGKLSEAWSGLREAIRMTSSTRTLTGAAGLLRQLRKKEAAPSRRKCKIALLGTVTLDFFAPVLDAIAFSFGIDVEFYIAPFGQFRQEIFDGQSGLSKFKPDVTFLLNDWRSLGLQNETSDPASLIKKIVGEYEGLWQQLREQHKTFAIQANWEVPVADAFGRLSLSLEGGRARVIQELNLELQRAQSRNAGVAILDLEQLASTTGKLKWNDQALWIAGKQYPSMTSLPLLARSLTGTLRAVFGMTSKCIALDLDGTLWGGIIGEDGLQGVALGGNAVGEAYVGFQRYLLEMRSRGIPLAVCSKNNEKDAQQPFQEHPEMVLKLDDVALFVANWQPKHDNLKAIAKSLNIGIDSIVFIDDNPAERTLIRQLLPDVEVPELPADPSQYIQSIHEQFLFESLSLTDEDRRRAASYRENAERASLQGSADNLDDYLKSLDMQVELLSFQPANLPRIVQLINKTNQFNLTTQRKTDAEVQEMAGRSDYYTQSMRLRDRFGDNGLTGVLIAVEEGDTLRIDNWLLSCRVLGRRVEELMLGSAIENAKARGLKWVVGEYLPTAKNAQVEDIYTRFGFEPVEQKAGAGKLYRWDVSKPFAMPDCFRVDTGVATESPIMAR